MLCASRDLSVHFFAASHALCTNKPIRQRITRDGAMVCDFDKPVTLSPHPSAGYCTPSFPLGAVPMDKLSDDGFPDLRAGGDGLE